MDRLALANDLDSQTHRQRPVRIKDKESGKWKFDTLREAVRAVRLKDGLDALHRAANADASLGSKVGILKPEAKIRPEKAKPEAGRFDGEWVSNSGHRYVVEGGAVTAAELDRAGTLRDIPGGQLCIMQLDGRLLKGTLQASSGAITWDDKDVWCRPGAEQPEPPAASEAARPPRERASSAERLEAAATAERFEEAEDGSGPRGSAPRGQGGHLVLLGLALLGAAAGALAAQQNQQLCYAAALLGALLVLGGCLRQVRGRRPAAARQLRTLTGEAGGLEVDGSYQLLPAPYVMLSSHG